MPVIISNAGPLHLLLYLDNELLRENFFILMNARLALRLKNAIFRGKRFLGGLGASVIQSSNKYFKRRVDRKSPRDSDY
jgi:hypothetical protein